MRARARARCAAAASLPRGALAAAPTSGPFARGRDGCAVYSAKEVARHTTPDDCWLIVKGKVYDVSGWGENHPGGVVIYTHGGKVRVRRCRPLARALRAG